MMHPREVIDHVRHIKPIYGWGWTGPDDATRDLPEPFRLSCANPIALEGVVLADHEFSGATVHLSSRHTSPDGCYNIEIKRNSVIIARGFAEA